MGFKVVIPARYGSARLPGKPLLDIGGRPMIAHVHERALQSGADQVVIATDDERIADAAQSLSAEVCMTANDHASGTERIAEVVARYDWSDESVIVNLQGDEPAMPPALVAQVADDMLHHAGASVTTLAARIETREQLFDPHLVKVVTDVGGYALYFSRAPIPWHRDEFLRQPTALPQSTEFLRHIGLYAYRAGFLRRYVGWQASPLELAESLEQLRVLFHGDRIHVSMAEQVPSHGVDTVADLTRIQRQLGAE